MKRGFGTYARAIEPITRQEFSQMLQKAKPPPGWGGVVAVANSGGPDSTCLLFLLHQYFDGRKVLQKGNSLKRCRPRLVSLTVDHGLQTSSLEMAARTATFSESMGVEHATRQIEWGQGMIPPRPPSGSPFEDTARQARYGLLFEEMTRLRANTLALGHHLDDQVETALMRLGMGSSILGASGMKHYRRWGMGNVVDGLDWAGYQGMSRWLIRPFLDVEKDRILATCEVNKLEYVVDKTNFQPEVTRRNAIRHVIKNSKSAAKPLPPDLSKQIEDISAALVNLPNFRGDLHSGPEPLRGLVRSLSHKVAELESQVDTIIQKERLPSPEGSFSISQKTISDLKDQPILQIVLILRILRYVSPKPWGSLQSQGRRRSQRLAELANRLMRSADGPTPPPFTMGSEVLWKPVFYRRNALKEKNSSYLERPQDVHAWLACRQPPDVQTAHNIAERNLAPLLLDSITTWVSGSRQSTLEILYDCRFLVQINLDSIPEEIMQVLSSSEAQLILSCEKRWFHPIIYLQTTDKTVLLHDHVEGADDEDANVIVESKRRTPKTAGWVHVKFIRELSAI